VGNYEYLSCKYFRKNVIKFYISFISKFLVVNLFSVALLLFTSLSNFTNIFRKNFLEMIFLLAREVLLQPYMLTSATSCRPMAPL
jgi:hypothetical protein